MKAYVLAALMACSVGAVEAAASKSSSYKSTTKPTFYKAPAKVAPSKTHTVAAKPKKKSFWGDAFEDVVQSDREQDVHDMLVGCEVEFLPSRKFKVDCDD